ncbi:MAG: DUF4276 family protein [Gemmataceae bacterium]|nr:DUF4276 family protein [Gemmataceae bacterium]
MRRLSLLVEGQGDVAAVPALVGQLLADLPAELQGHLFLDDAPLKTGGIHQLTGRRSGDFVRLLGVANKRPKLGAALLVLDGDTETIESNPFCAVAAARLLAERARDAGAGTIFSFAAVFLRQEYESLFIAVADQLPGYTPKGTTPPDPEETPRGAKGWLHERLADGYNPTDRQLVLTRAVKNWEPARALKSFRRLEHALVELATAVALGEHVASPSLPPPEVPGEAATAD